MAINARPIAVACCSPREERGGPLMAQALEQAGRPRSPCRPSSGRAGGAAPRPAVLLHGQPGDRRAPRNERDPQLHGGEGAHPASQSTPSKHDRCRRSAGGAPAIAAQQCRLAGPVGADQRDGLAVADRQREVAHGLEQAVAVGRDARRLSRLTRRHLRVGVDRRGRRSSRAAGLAVGETRPVSMQTRRSTTWTRTWTMCSIQTIAIPAPRSCLIITTSSAASASVSPAPISSSSQHDRVGRERAGELEPLAPEQSERLGPAVAELRQAAQLEHLQAAIVRRGGVAGRRRSWRRRSSSRTPSCRRRAGAPGARGRSPGASAGSPRSM